MKQINFKYMRTACVIYASYDRVGVEAKYPWATVSF